MIINSNSFAENVGMSITFDTETKQEVEEQVAEIATVNKS